MTQTPNDFWSPIPNTNPAKWFTAGEVAEVAKNEQVKCIPWTKDGVIKWIKRECDPEDVANFARTRRGKEGGGGTEYYWAFFPGQLYGPLEREIERRNKSKPWEEPTPKPKRVPGKDLPRDFSAPSGGLARTLAADAGLDPATVFEPYSIRRVSRCLVRLSNRKYFSAALNSYHDKEVCVTRCNAEPDLIWVMQFDKPRYAAWGPGKLICIADARANVAPYVPLELQRAAEAKRAKGQTRRLLLK